MRKVIAALNMTLDGMCDHTYGVVDEELHQHYSELIRDSGVILYGRKTYELMQFWPQLLEKPSGDRSMDEFALAIDKVPKLVFSNTLQNSNWSTATIAHQSLLECVPELRQMPGKNILIGSRSLIIQLLNNHLIDEFQIGIHPLIAGKGLRMFEGITNQVMLGLHKTKSLQSGVTIFYYEPRAKR